MKINKTIIIVLVFVLNLLALMVTVPAIVTNGKEYEEMIDEARGYYENELYEKAMYAFDSALMLEDTLELRTEMAMTYKKGLENGEFSSFYKFSNFLYDIVDSYRKVPKAYDIVLQHFYEFNKLDDCVSIIYQAEDMDINTEYISKIREEVRYKCEVSFATYEDIAITPEHTYLIKNDKYTLCNSKLNTIISTRYEYATPMIEGYSLVKTSDNIFLISETGTRESYFSNEIVESTGVGNSLIACKINDGYSYYNLKSEKVFGEYIFAGRFSNGVAAVQDIEGWKIINTDGSTVQNIVFEDVKLSQSMDCAQYGVIFAKKNGKYDMYDIELNKIAELGADDVDTFVEADSLAAVCKDGQWGFVSKSGKVIIDFQYEQAKSFSRGLGGVKNGEYWSFINDKNDMVITGEFTDVNYFNQSGYCFVKNEVYWYYLSRYYNR